MVSEETIKQTPRKVAAIKTHEWNVHADGAMPHLRRHLNRRQIVDADQSSSQLDFTALNVRKSFVDV